MRVNKESGYSMVMSKKEGKIQKALGLEKGFITRLNVKIPIYVDVPIIVKGTSLKEVYTKLSGLSDNMKKRIIKHMCKVLMEAEFMCTATDLGGEAFAVIETLSKSKLKDICPAQLNLDNDSIDIDTDVDADSVDAAIDYLKEEISLDDGEILII